MTRAHACIYETPLTATFSKLPSTAECTEHDCHWQRNCTVATPQALQDLRSLAIHHAKQRKHTVLVHLRQDLLLTPEGEPEATGGGPVPLAPAAVHNPVDAEMHWASECDDRGCRR